MPQANQALHHLHKRKRVHQNLETLPSSNPWKNFLDKAIYVISFLGPLFTIPQVTEVWIGKDASGVSLISWVAYTFSATVWLLYGIAHKDKPIIFANILWIIMDAAVAIGVVVYG